jgi:ribonuclease HII
MGPSFYSFKDPSMCQIENKLMNKGYKCIAGIDEAGRGALAGPVVAACVILDGSNIPEGITDSKKINDTKRRMLFQKIWHTAVSIGVGTVEPHIIDSVNIYGATKLAMKASISDMTVQPDFLLIDAVKLYDISISSLSLVKGEDKSVSIAAASIIAKVHRDNIMYQLSQIYPEYGFDVHKGYGTAYHRETLKKCGPSEIHRYSYKPVFQAQTLWKLKGQQ